MSISTINIKGLGRRHQYRRTVLCRYCYATHAASAAKCGRQDITGTTPSYQASLSLLNPVGSVRSVQAVDLERLATRGSGLVLLMNLAIRVGNPSTSISTKASEEAVEKIVTRYTHRGRRITSTHMSSKKDQAVPILDCELYSEALLAATRRQPESESLR